LIGWPKTQKPRKNRAYEHFLDTEVRRPKPARRHRGAYGIQDDSPKNDANPRHIINGDDPAERAAEMYCGVIGHKRKGKKFTFESAYGI
jgi:hypothetical protein